MTALGGAGTEEADVHAVTTPNHASGMTDCTVAVFWARTVNWKTTLGECSAKPTIGHRAPG